jgi:hypothetical protein
LTALVPILLQSRSFQATLIPERRDRRAELHASESAANRSSVDGLSVNWPCQRHFSRTGLTPDSAELHRHTGHVAYRCNTARAHLANDSVALIVCAGLRRFLSRPYTQVVAIQVKVRDRSDRYLPADTAHAVGGLDAERISSRLASVSTHKASPETIQVPYHGGHRGMLVNRVSGRPSSHEPVVDNSPGAIVGA